MMRMPYVLAGCVLLGLQLWLPAGTFQVNNSRELTQLMVRLRATQFLQHATFGPSDAEIDSLAARMQQIGVTAAAEEWIDQQFAEPVTRHMPVAEDMVIGDGLSPTQSGINVSRYRYQAWWHNSITAKDQLRQRMAWALIQICVVGQSGGNFNSEIVGPTGRARWLGMSNYYDLLLDNSFGTYRDVLGGVTFHPVMGVWLSHLRNAKADPAKNFFPDENYAREVLQLFSIGLYELNPDGTYQTDADGALIPTYDNTHIETFARLFTGLTYAGSRSITSGAINFDQPMMMFESSHDTQAKVLFGTTLPAGTPGMADINAGLDDIFNHPNTGPFICRRLIQRFVRSNPSKGYMNRVVSRYNDNGSGIRGDLKAVIKQILLDQEAWDGIRMVRRSNPWRLEVSGQGSERSRFQEPVVMYANFLRRYASTDYQNGWFMIPSLSFNWSQYPYGSGSVFNFYSPDYQPAGEISEYNGSPLLPTNALYAPEFAIFDAVVANRTPNRYRSDIYNERTVHTLINNSNATLRCTISYDFAREKTLAANPLELVEHLDKVFCCGTLSNDAKMSLVSALNLNTNTTTRARAAILGVLTSPAFAIAE